MSSSLLLPPDKSGWVADNTWRASRIPSTDGTVFLALLEAND